MKTEYPAFISTAKGRSFFALISNYWKAKKETNNRAFHRLCSLMRKMDAKKVFVEKLDGSEDEIAEERKALKNILSRMQTLMFIVLPFYQKASPTSRH